MILTRDQKLRVCRALARRARHEHLVGDERPTRALAEEVASPSCSTSEWILLQLGYAVWTGATGPGHFVGLMLVALSPAELDLVGRLLQALAAKDGSALEAWLRAAGVPGLELVP